MITSAYLLKKLRDRALMSEIYAAKLLRAGRIIGGSLYGLVFEHYVQYVKTKRVLPLRLRPNDPPLIGPTDDPHRRDALETIFNSPAVTRIKKTRR